MRVHPWPPALVTGQGKRAPTLKTGTVVASFGRRFSVRCDDGAVLTCMTRGRRHDIACGDRVRVAAAGPDQGVIEIVVQRTSLFYRSDIQRQKLIAANVGQIVVVLAAVPSPHLELLDRCLAAAEDGGIHALLVLNKTDLPQADAVRASLEPYRALGYPVLALAARADVAPLRARLAGLTSVLVGQSGVGKSTIINRLLPDAAAQTGELSQALDSGRHTTTHARLYHLDGTGSVIDSPGLQEFGLQHVGAAGLAHCYVDFRRHLGRCRFNDCRHVDEPGCAIAAAAEHGDIHPHRLASYRTLLTQLLRKARHQR